MWRTLNLYQTVSFKMQYSWIPTHHVFHSNEIYRTEGTLGWPYFEALPYSEALFKITIFLHFLSFFHLMMQFIRKRNSKSSFENTVQELLPMIYCKHNALNLIRCFRSTFAVKVQLTLISILNESNNIFYGTAIHRYFQWAYSFWLGKNKMRKLCCIK